MMCAASANAAACVVQRERITACWTHKRTSTLSFRRLRDFPAAFFYAAFMVWEQICSTPDGARPRAPRLILLRPRTSAAPHPVPPVPASRTATPRRASTNSRTRSRSRTAAPPSCITRHATTSPNSRSRSRTRRATIPFPTSPPHHSHPHR